MKRTVFFLLMAAVTSSWAQNSMNKMNLLALALSEKLDQTSDMDLICYESGFMIERTSSIYDILYRPFKANTQYAIVAYADARIEDFELRIEKQTPSGQWEALKSLNENKRKQISNDPTNEIGDYEMLKDLVVTSDGECRIVLISNKTNSRAGRYGVMVYAKEL
jgi:hypothetical protein